MKQLVNNLKRRKELKEELKLHQINLYALKVKFDSINQELDSIAEGKLVADEAHVGTLLQLKIKCQQDAAEHSFAIIDIEDKLKELF